MAPKLQLAHIHAWDLTPEEARKLQEELRRQVSVQPLKIEEVKWVAGVDASFDQGKVIGAVTVLEFSTLLPVEQSVVDLPIPFPYIPGLLSFRETPALLAAIEKLSIMPQVFVVDGHGLAHPRRFGIACHLGVLLNLPTVGLAKSILVGRVGVLGDQAGSTAKLQDRGETIGMVVRTRPGSNPVYVSIGHRVDLPSAVHLIMECTRGYRLPEPARLAHQLATDAKKGIPR